MRNIVSILFCFLLILIIYGCNEADVNYGSLISGKYIGIYTLTENVGSNNTVDTKDSITFVFTESGYSYYAKNHFIPPGGAGKYIIDSKTFTLTDTVGHTADSDWTLILNGRFSYNILGKELTFSQYDTKYNRYYKLDLYKQQ
jgi:hypothetical protein